MTATLERERPSFLHPEPTAAEPTAPVPDPAGPDPRSASTPPGSRHRVRRRLLAAVAMILLAAIVVVAFAPWTAEDNSKSASELTPVKIEKLDRTADQGRLDVSASPAATKKCPAQPTPLAPCRSTSG